MDALIFPRAMFTPKQQSTASVQLGGPTRPTNIPPTRQLLGEVCLVLLSRDGTSGEPAPRPGPPGPAMCRQGRMQASLPSTSPWIELEVAVIRPGGSRWSANKGGSEPTCYPLWVGTLVMSVARFQLIHHCNPYPQPKEDEEKGVICCTEHGNLALPEL